MEASESTVAVVEGDYLVWRGYTGSLIYPMATMGCLVEYKQSDTAWCLNKNKKNKNNK
jgi:hypothetical protein